VRPCDIFLKERGRFLSELGYESDLGRVEYGGEHIILYHYTRSDRIDKVFASGSGLRARLPVLTSELTPEFERCFYVEGLLEPFPQWFKDGPHFGNLPLEMVKKVVGRKLLRIKIPRDFPGIYVWDHAHGFECQHVYRRGKLALGLGYDCRTGHEINRAITHSYIPIKEYDGGHLAPGVRVVRGEEGIAIPNNHLSISNIQPLEVESQKQKTN